MDLPENKELLLEAKSHAMRVYQKLPPEEQKLLNDLAESQARQALSNFAKACKTTITQAKKTRDRGTQAAATAVFRKAFGNGPKDPKLQKTWQSAFELAMVVVMQRRGMLKLECNCGVSKGLRTNHEAECQSAYLHLPKSVNGGGQ